MSTLAAPTKIAMNLTTHMTPTSRAKGSPLLATIITLIVVVAALATLLMNTLFTGMFFARPPRGDGAVGLIVPFFGLGATILAFTLAAILAAFRVSTSAVGAVGGMSSSPFVAGLMVIVVTLGAALATGIAFILWCEPTALGKSLRVLTIPVGIMLGVVGPVILATMLLAGVWMSKPQAVSALAAGGGQALGLKAGFIAVCLLALAGFGLGGAMFGKEIRRFAGNRAAAMAEAIKTQEMWDAKGRMPLAQRLSEELAEFSPNAPLWSILAYLPDRPDAKDLNDECREIVVMRALKVADIDAELVQCMQSRYYLYRQGAAEFLIEAPESDFAAHRDAWGRALLLGLEATGDGIACRPGWMIETFDMNPDPLGHVRSLLKAAERFKNWSEHEKIRQRFGQMADDAGMLNASKDRDKLLKMLAEAGYRAAEVRPGR